MYPRKPEHFDDGDDAFVRALREALKPEPLPGALAERIRDEWDQRGQLSLHRRYLPLHVLGIAAAACLAITLVLPSQTSPRTIETAERSSLSSDEAAAIVSALGVISWDDYTEYSLEVVGTSIGEIESTLRGETNSGMPPWSSDENWDLPSGNDGGASRGRMPGRGLSAASAPAATPIMHEV